MTEMRISETAKHNPHKAGVSTLRWGRKNSLRVRRAGVLSRTRISWRGATLGTRGCLRSGSLASRTMSSLMGALGRRARSFCVAVSRTRRTRRLKQRDDRRVPGACGVATCRSRWWCGRDARRGCADAWCAWCCGGQQAAYAAVGTALEVIPRTLAANCGADVVSVVTELRAKHASGQSTWGVDGMTGELRDMALAGGIWEPLEVKAQCLKSAVEAACTLLRVDDVVSGIKNKNGGNGQGAANPNIPAAPMPHGL